MGYIDPRYLAHQAKRFIRHDWERYMRPDWRDRKYWVGEPPEHPFDPPPHASQSARKPAPPPSADEIAAAERERLELQRSLNELRLELAAIKRDLLLRKAFNPNQPRVPEGNPDGGRWTNDEGQAEAIQVAQLGGTLTDADGTPYYKPGGHHEMPKGVYTKWTLRPETKEVFDKATTGRAPPVRLRTTPDGVPQGHFWNGPGGAHGIYNEAVDELSKQFLRDNNIKPEQMTPDHARALLTEIRESQDPRIRDYNATIKMLRRIFRLRTGRGVE